MKFRFVANALHLLSILLKMRISTMLANERKRATGLEIARNIARFIWNTSHDLMYDRYGAYII